MEIARRCLASGRLLLDNGFPESAGRDAYLAAFHAALAFIVARTGREPKTHRGTRTEFSRLARDEPTIPRAHLTFLAKGFELKIASDYGDGDASDVAEASASPEVAERIVTLVVVLTADPQSA